MDEAGILLAYSSAILYLEGESTHTHTPSAAERRERIKVELSDAVFQTT